jgi:hypothetical protein
VGEIGAEGFDLSTLSTSELRRDLSLTEESVIEGLDEETLEEKVALVVSVSERFLADPSRRDPHRGVRGEGAPRLDAPLRRGARPDPRHRSTGAPSSGTTATFLRRRGSPRARSRGEWKFHGDKVYRVYDVVYLDDGGEVRGMIRIEYPPRCE